MNYRAGQTSEGRGSFPSKEKWILRVSLDVCADGCFIVQLLHVWMPSIHCPASCISAFWGVESGIFNYCKLTYKICKREFCFAAVLRGGSEIKYLPW